MQRVERSEAEFRPVAPGEVGTKLEGILRHRQ
jgi:hypothetical protein